MRISTYEIILPLFDKNKNEIPGKTLLVNGLYGAFDIIDKNDAQKIQAGNFSELSLELREKMLSRGHLTRKNESEEFEDMKILAKISKQIYGRIHVNAVIMPTYDCNFRCPYCYEQHRLSKGQDWLNNTMSDETVEAVFSALKNYKERGFLVDHCVFYGGEPLLAKNIHVVRKIAERFKELDITMAAVTNAYELESYIDLLEEFKFKSLQITVDGVAEVNNRSRIHKDGKPTYDKILNNIELALEHGIAVSVRVNIGNENIHDIGALIEDFKKRGFMDKEKARKQSAVDNQKTTRGKFSYYFKAVNNDLNPKKNVSERDIFEELLRTGIPLQEALQLNTPFSAAFGKLRALFNKDIFFGFSAYDCGAESGMVVIDPFGTIYTCWDFVGKEDKSVGYVDKENGRFIWNFAKAKWVTRTVDLMENCQTCPYCLICGGGCASRAAFEHGNCFRESCGEGKEIFNFVASHLAGEYWNKNHQSELSLSLSGPIARLTPKERETILTTKSQKELFDLANETGIFAEPKDGVENGN